MMTWSQGGGSFAEVLKKKIQKDAEDAKLRAVEEATARQEEAKAKVLRDAELKAKQERVAAQREQQASDGEHSHRWQHGGRQRFGHRSFLERDRTVSGAKSDSNTAVAVGGDGCKDALHVADGSHDGPNSDGSADVASQASGDGSPLQAAKDGQGNAEEKSAVSDVAPETPRPGALPVVPPATQQSTKTSGSPSESPKTNGTTSAAASFVSPAKKEPLAPAPAVVTQNGVSHSTNDDAAAGRKKSVSSGDDVRLAQQPDGAQNDDQDRRRNGNAHGAAVEQQGDYRYPLYHPGYNGYNMAQQNGVHTNGYGSHVQFAGPQPFYGTPQYYQPVTEITTRNGPLFINPLAYPGYVPSFNDMYSGDLSNGYYGHNSYYSAGHGNGDMQTPPGVLSPQPSVIKSFYFDSEQTGLVIGKSGHSLDDDRWRFECEIWIDEEEARKLGVSTLHFYGVDENVDAAVASIRRRLEKNGSELYPIMGVQTGTELHPPITKLDLPEGVVLQAFISHVDESGFVFLQLPSHPTYTKIRNLEVRLSNRCADNNLSPFIDVRHSPIVEGCVVAASINEDCQKWLRAAVISLPDDNGETRLRSLDHGFPFLSHSSCLKFLPEDFCATPVQAIECRVVSGRFDYEKSVEEQIDSKVSGNISKQWVKVKAVAKDEARGLPVVEIYLSPPNSAPPQPPRAVTADPQIVIPA